MLVLHISTCHISIFSFISKFVDFLKIDYYTYYSWVLFRYNSRTLSKRTCAHTPSNTIRTGYSERKFMSICERRLNFQFVFPIVVILSGKADRKTQPRRRLKLARPSVRTSHLYAERLLMIFRWIFLKLFFSFQCITFLLLI